MSGSRRAPKSAARRGECERVTGETAVRVAVDLDRPDAVRLETPIPFLTHMLDQVARHGRLGLEVSAAYTGLPLAHHLAEDVGIALGLAFDRALGGRVGVNRFGWALAPMDESLAEATVDLSGRGGFYGEVAFAGPLADGYEAVNGPEFLRALAVNARLTLHLDLKRGGNPHHELEACHKAVALALRQAAALPSESGGARRARGVPSTKGVL
ncbi:MAG: imidazoleglycerol-phosphate dehydratase [Bacillota bacterium]